MPISSRSGMRASTLSSLWNKTGTLLSQGGLEYALHSRRPQFSHQIGTNEGPALERKIIARMKERQWILYQPFGRGGVVAGRSLKDYHRHHSDDILPDLANELDIVNPVNVCQRMATLNLSAHDVSQRRIVYQHVKTGHPVEHLSIGNRRQSLLVELSTVARGHLFARLVLVAPSRPAPTDLAAVWTDLDRLASQPLKR